MKMYLRYNGCSMEEEEKYDLNDKQIKELYAHIDNLPDNLNHSGEYDIEEYHETLIKLHLIIIINKDKIDENKYNVFWKKASAAGLLFDDDL